MAEQRSDFKRSLLIYRQLLEREPDHLGHLEQLARLSLQLQNRKDAAYYLARRADALARIGAFDASLADLNQAILLDAKRPYLKLRTELEAHVALVRAAQPEPAPEQIVDASTLLRAGAKPKLRIDPDALIAELSAPKSNSDAPKVEAPKPAAKKPALPKLPALPQVPKKSEKTPLLSAHPAQIPPEKASPPATSESAQKKPASTENATPLYTKDYEVIATKAAEKTLAPEETNDSTLGDFDLDTQAWLCVDALPPLLKKQEESAPKSSAPEITQSTPEVTSGFESAEVTKVTAEIAAEEREEDFEMSMAASPEDLSPADLVARLASEAEKSTAPRLEESSLKTVVQDAEEIELIELSLDEVSEELEELGDDFLEIVEDELEELDEDAEDETPFEERPTVAWKKIN